MSHRVVAVLACGMLIFAGCDTKKKIDNAVDKASKLMDEVSKLVKTLNDGAAAAKKAATKAVSSLKPSAKAKVPSLPPSVTGNANITKAAAGKEGTAKLDVDGDGKEDDIYVFEDEGGTLYRSWEGSEGGSFDDAGICYLIWDDSEGNAWIVYAECGATDGAWIGVFSADNNEKWLACNTAGKCTTCSDDPEEACDWPTGDEPEDDAGVPEDDAEVPPEDGSGGGCEDVCSALVECELLTSADLAGCDEDCNAGSSEEFLCLFEAADCDAMALCLPE